MIFVSVLLPCPVLSARAEESETYACVLSEGTYLYAEQSEESGLFLIPNTYYVRILEQGAEYSYVEYAADSGLYKAVRGYCKSEALTPVDFTPARPFVNLTVSLTYRLEGTSALVGGDLALVTVEAAYYGDYTVGSAQYCYVCANGKFGYVPRPEISYELNDDYLPEAPPVSAETQDVSVSLYILIGALCLWLVFILLLSLRPAKKQRAPDNDWYEE